MYNFMGYKWVRLNRTQEEKKAKRQVSNGAREKFDKELLKKLQELLEERK